MTGPGIWIRIQHRFGPRLSEWMLAVMASIWGYVLLLPPTTFTGAAWQFFVEQHIGENAVGTVMIIFGVARLIGLIINGALEKVTPIIRVISAGVGFFLWIGISYSFAQSGVVSTWIAIYPILAIVEAINVVRAAHDTGESYGPVLRH